MDIFVLSATFLVILPCNYACSLMSELIQILVLMVTFASPHPDYSQQSRHQSALVQLLLRISSDHIVSMKSEKKGNSNFKETQVWMFFMLWCWWHI